MNKAIIGIIAVVLIATGAFFAFGRKTDDKTTNQPVSQPAATPSSDTPKATVSASSNEIVYDCKSFSPSTLTAKTGEEVTITNKSDCNLQFESDPHPVHTEDSELNQGSISPGSSKTFKVTQTGTHGYHNHLDSSQTGTLVVQ